jgi:hypothetical protein
MREVAAKAFVVGAWLILPLVVIQIFLAGLGIFDDAYFFFWHAAVNAPIVFFLPVLLVLIGWFGRVPRRLLGLAGAVTGLTLLQSLLLLPYHLGAQGVLRAISGLHVLNALLILWIALQLLGRTRDWATRVSQAPLAVSPAPAMEASTTGEPVAR